MWDTIKLYEILGMVSQNEIGEKWGYNNICKDTGQEFSPRLIEANVREEK